MSDSQVLPGKNNLDLIDEEWVKDSLSDDEVEIAPGSDLPTDDGDVVGNSVNIARKEEEDKWNDLGLETFQQGH